ncbi:prim-pol domain-containing protein [Conidiobolus coronatus NRRL 28638]|uniref:DNA primase n=1 Tax=Conidiobolus coronatus (strain ATCC 28846 / CBS 209.66 / NRRL 28638) TaxID=796925 RepID=A0A137PF10_CONC2|nr:prim-pol domain-containing protein [Conidiobolus coronatus NRRL 28638]|eukprot:KXN73531.1 prim-pol domain-containing protein [Conidiobolus coronatus NRRL 28638]
MTVSKDNNDMEVDTINNNNNNMEIDEVIPEDILEGFEFRNFADNMRVYYQKLFPHQLMFQWLNYSNTTPTANFTSREFSFTLEDDIYIRYQSFDNVTQFKQKLTQLNPIKIDIGSIYTQPPKLKNTMRPAAFQPTEKELVFDIDLTDYDEIRTCCSEANICSKCWKFMQVAINIIYDVLKEDFAFEHVLVVYSGRRGIHIWVCDERARKLNNDQRRSIVNYIDIIKGGVNQGRKVNLSHHLHPSLKRLTDLIENKFIEIALEDQDILGDVSKSKQVFEFFPESVLSQSDRQTLIDEWSSRNSSSEDRWNELTQLILANSKKIKGKSTAIFNNSIRDFKFQHIYPRLDVNVSTHLNHLLKAPFCVHPKTERVCIPISPENFNEFDPEEAPKLQALINQIHHTETKKRRLNPDENEQQPVKLAWTQTDLAGYIKYFKEFVEKVNVKIQKEQVSMEF